MISLIVVVLVIWLLVLFSLMTPTSFYRNAFNRLTNGKYQNDRVSLQIMLDHLRSFPEQWQISRDGASFPKDSRAKQIYITHDKGVLNYTLNSFGNNARPLDGHFGKEFGAELARINTETEKQALLRNFYPELDGTLLLGESK